MQQKRSKPAVKSSADTTREVTRSGNFQQGPQLHRHSVKAAVAGYKIQDKVVG